ncbi:MAG: hypothetical protein LBH75_04920, partial [Treponema sp.]|nr:hypothetical protein [Treponema sp.]
MKLNQVSNESLTSRKAAVNERYPPPPAEFYIYITDKPREKAGILISLLSGKQPFCLLIIHYQEDHGFFYIFFKEAIMAGLEELRNVLHVIRAWLYPNYLEHGGK